MVEVVPEAVPLERVVLLIVMVVFVSWVVVVVLLVLPEVNPLPIVHVSEVDMDTFGHRTCTSC